MFVNLPLEYRMTALYLINVPLIFGIHLIRKKADVSLFKQVVLFEAAWTIFLSLLGLFFVFDVLESKDENQSFMKAAGTENIIFLSTVAGFILIHLSLFLINAQRFFKRRKIKN